MEKVSIIIPTYNSIKRINSCLESVINQTYKYYEIIIVDGGSNDGTYEYCLELSKKDKRINIFKSEKGVSKQRNYGLSKANGIYICFVDSDDTINSTYIETLSNKMSEGYDIVLPIHFVNNNLPKFNKPFEDFLYTRDNYFEIVNKNFLSHCSVCKMFRKAIIRKTKFREDLVFGEDLFFNYDLIKQRRQKCCVCNLAQYSVYRGKRQHKKYVSKDISVFFDYLLEEINNANNLKSKKNIQFKFARTYISVVLSYRGNYIFIPKYLSKYRHLIHNYCKLSFKDFVILYCPLIYFINLVRMFFLKFKKNDVN